MKAIAAATGVLLMATSVAPAFACITGNAGQRILRNHVVATPGEPVSVTILDLLSVSLPAQGGATWRIEQGTTDTPLLRELTQEQLASARQSPKFVTFNKISNAVKKTGQTDIQLHFGAVAAGRATVTFVNDAMRPPSRHELHVEVLPRHVEQARRGTLKKVGADQADKPVTMQYYDTLEITLPGTPDEQWDTSSAKAAGLEFKEKRAGSSGTVILVFRPTSASSRSAVLTLIGGGENVYKFHIQHQPTPVC